MAKKPSAKPALKNAASPKAAGVKPASSKPASVKPVSVKPATKPTGVKASPPVRPLQDVAGPAAVRMPDGGVKMVDKEMAEAVAARVAEVAAEADKPAAKVANLPATTKQQPADKKTPVEKLGDRESVQIEASILAAALHCAAKNDVRYYLNGVHLFEHREGVLRIEAANGHVLFVHDYPVEKVPAWAKAGGVVVNRENLGRAVSAAGKNDGVVLELSTGIGHPHMTVGTWPDQWATFRLEMFDNVKFPDTEKIAEGAAGTLSHSGERTPLDTTAIDANYFKLATLVAQSLNIPGVQAYMGDGKSAAVFTFGVRRAALYVMPIRDGGAMSVQAASVLAPAVRGSVGALKAHQTRNEQAAKEAKDPEEAKALREKAAGFAKRIKELMGAANEAKALPAPEKKAA
ncbi:hypothetical protein VAR608DRAFT_4905 [Variovorax sp. HW608]|uniref:hypothetical protein n=1 Tax=Variovorax sp. HW608 TaxID=1034889 RepID=UPI00081FAE47|nr:hypothetical protein [Variovorax sp. HW608]SCK49287.1 hypothetical protein VAR608DRAFT_4905 [Variovorax sp. HW608]